MKKIWKHRYQMIEEIGNGGNGKVYKVWDLHLEKEWAMKILDKKNGRKRKREYDDENIDEVTALKKISHPNFPRIVDAFEEEEGNILVMDYISGITLEDMIAKGAMKEEEMVLILFQICEAILYLHQSMPILLYLDLKPANIIIEENRTVKLVDLGSVSVKGKRGRISGSFGYASPEQVKAKQEGSCLTEQSDIFSFGMVIYAMATGSSTKLPIVDGKRRCGVYIRRENPFLSSLLERIVEKCTRGNCNRRYGSMREVQRELEIWALHLQKRKRFPVPYFSFGRIRKQMWYQEKSILCTEGKHSFYIAKKILILFIGILSLLPGKVSLAGENTEEMRVIIRDTNLRKVLVKEGCAYETSSSILLEIPWEEIVGESCRITVECQDESREKKRYYIECIYVK